MITETTTIGPNWEVLISLEMRKGLNIKEGDKIIMVRENDEIILRKFT